MKTELSIEEYWPAVSRSLFVRETQAYELTCLQRARGMYMSTSEMDTVQMPPGYSASKAISRSGAGLIIRCCERSNRYCLNLCGLGNSAKW